MASKLQAFPAGGRLHLPKTAETEALTTQPPNYELCGLPRRLGRGSELSRRGRTMTPWQRWFSRYRSRNLRNA